VRKYILAVVLLAGINAHANAQDKCAEPQRMLQQASDAYNEALLD
jgi:hypothetical protein